MDLNLSPEENAFRDEVRSFIDDKLPDDIRQKVASGGGYGKDEIQRWNEILHEKGWVAPAWPAEHGGTGWSTIQIYLFE